MDLNTVRKAANVKDIVTGPPNAKGSSPARPTS
ncbi:hypothetical protein MMX123_02029 [Microbacterium sp. MM2322]